MTSPLNDRHLGEYRLKELIRESDLTMTWLAEQVSVARQVLVDELRPEQEERRDAFLADIRAKAAVDHPLVGSVYEAVSNPELCYFAHELLPGTTLAERKAAGISLEPGELAHVLRRVTEAQLQHEALGQATSPLELDDIHLNEHGVIRLENLAIAGTRSTDQAERDIARLGETLPALVAIGKPGATRMLTLLGWMRGEGLETPLCWQQVCQFCAQIEQQLNEPTPPDPAAKSGHRSPKKPSVVIISVAGGLALIAILALALRMRPPTPPPAAPRAALPAAVLISGGTHPTPDGTDESLQSFRISAHEVTIGEYAEFLEILDTLSQDQRHRIFDHESQPAEKTSHLPDDWAALHAAAKAQGIWNQRPVTLDCPVVGVDWWDANAYAEWKHARLATQEEWFAAVRSDVADPSAIKPAGWAPVTAAATDRTPLGILGLAGSVSEWTRRPAPNPANPLGERKWVIIGGSYLKPGSNALTREFTDDRALRRPDLGFRLVFSAN